MTVSSIYLQKGDVNFADKHNSRNTEKEPSYLLEKQYRKTNDFVKIADAHTLYHEQLFIRQKSHARGRTPELKDVFYEAVVNLEEKHTLQDVQKVASHLKAVYGFQPCSIAIHRDEGYVDKITKEVKYNLHAHLTFLCMKDGISTKRKLNAKKLSEMQTEVANILGMKRGQEHSKAKRLDHQQYRAVKRAEEELMREDAKNFCKLHNEKINKLQSTMIQPLLKLSQELTEEKSQLETEKAELETKLEAEKKNVKTVYVDKPVPRVLTDDEIELLPRVAELKKKLTESETALTEAPIKTQKELNDLKSKIRKEMIAESGFTQEQYKALNAAAADIKKLLKTESYTASDIINTLLNNVSKIAQLETEKQTLTTQLEAEKKNIKTVTKSVLRDYTDDEIDNLPKVVELNGTVKSLNEQLEAEKKNVKTVYVDKPVPRVLTDDEIELLPRVVSLKKKLTELQQKVESLTQAQSQRELERQSATVTVHNFESKHQKSSITPQKRSQSDESTIKRVEVQQISQSQPMSKFEAPQPKEKLYTVQGLGYMTAKQIRAEAQSDDIGHFTSEEFKRALTADEFREVFGEPQQVPQKKQSLFARVKHSLER